jgi:hypothetical protein
VETRFFPDYRFRGLVVSKHAIVQELPRPISRSQCSPTARPGTCCTSEAMLRSSNAPNFQVSKAPCCQNVREVNVSCRAWTGLTYIPNIQISILEPSRPSSPHIQSTVEVAIIYSAIPCDVHSVTAHETFHCFWVERLG